MSSRTGFRGQPLLALAAVMTGWAGLRFAYWENPFPASLPQFVQMEAKAPRRAAVVPLPEAQQAEVRVPQAVAPNWPLGERVQQAPALLPPLARPLVQPILPERMEKPAPPLPTRLVASHNLMLVAGLARLPVPESVASLFDAAARAPTPQATPFPQPSFARAERKGERWSADAWLMLRRESANSLAPGLASYGRSQAGAVLRYRLSQDSGNVPHAFVRATTALSGPRDATLATGLAARPVPALPIVAAVEVRARDGVEGLEAHPAGFAYTELPVVELPLGLRGEAYLQAGYVGGPYATGFADGQARLDRALARSGALEMRAGGGAWGGVQEGAGRFDIGPTASVSASVGGTPVRLSTDWRFRIAGSAEPSSGPALTISAGF